MRKNTKLIFVTCLTIFVVTLVGCGKKSGGGGQQQYQGPINTWNGQNQFGAGQNCIDTGCGVPQRCFNTLAERCNYIQTSPELQNCNPQARQMLYQQQCMNVNNGLNNGVVVGGSFNAGVSGQIVYGPRGRSYDERREVRYERRYETSTTTTSNSGTQSSGPLTAEERRQIIREVGICQPRPNVVTREYVTQTEIEHIRAERKPVRIKCSKKLVKIAQERSKSIDYIAYVELEDVLKGNGIPTDLELTRAELVKACDCMEERNCKLDDKADGENLAGWKRTDKRGEGFCEDDQRKLRVRECVNYGLANPPKVTAPPRPGPCVYRDNGTSQSVDCNPNPAPANPPQVNQPAPQVPVAAPAQKTCEDERKIPTNLCYGASGWLNADINDYNLPDFSVDDKTTRLEDQIKKLSDKHPNGRMIVAITDISFSRGTSKDLMNAFLDREAQNKMCTIENTGTNPCPIVKIEKESNAIAIVNGSRAKIVTAKNLNGVEGFVYAYIDINMVQQVNYGDNEIEIISTYPIHYDPSTKDLISATKAQCTPDVISDKVRLTQRIVFTKTKTERKQEIAKLKKGAGIVKLESELGRTDLDAQSACKNQPGEGH